MLLKFLDDSFSLDFKIVNFSSQFFVLVSRLKSLLLAILKKLLIESLYSFSEGNSLEDHRSDIFAWV
jgi:hypothetical protein